MLRSPDVSQSGQGTKEHIFLSTHHAPGENGETFDYKEGKLTPKASPTKPLYVFLRGRFIWKEGLMRKEKSSFHQVPELLFYIQQHLEVRKEMTLQQSQRVPI